MGLLCLNYILALCLLSILDIGNKVLVNCQNEDSYEDYNYNYSGGEEYTDDEKRIKDLRHQVKKFKSDLSRLKDKKVKLEDELYDCLNKNEPRSLKKRDGLSRKSYKKDSTSDFSFEYEDEQKEKDGEPKRIINELEKKVRELKKQIEDLKREIESLNNKLIECEEKSEEQTEPPTLPPPPPPPPTTTTRPTPKPKTTKKYIIRINKVTWQEAYDLCRRENKYLATIRSQREQDALGRARRHQGVDSGQLWVAGFREYANGGFSWKGREITPFTYTNWHSTEPSNWSDENQNCVESSWQENKYMWFLYECHTEYNYACEYFD